MEVSLPMFGLQASKMLCLNLFAAVPNTPQPKKSSARPTPDGPRGAPVVAVAGGLGVPLHLAIQAAFQLGLGSRLRI